jgi:hypothetical protein
MEVDATAVLADQHGGVQSDCRCRDAETERARQWPAVQQGQREDDGRGQI